MYLGNSEQSLGDVDNTSQLLDVLDPVLHGLRVIGAGLVQDVLDFVLVRLGPLLVQGASVRDKGTPNAQQTEGDDGLLVDDIVLVADGVDGQTGSGGQDGGLGDERVAGQGVDDGLRLGLGRVVGDARRARRARRPVGCRTGGDLGQGGQGREGRSRNDGGAESGSPCGSRLVRA